MNPEVIFWYTFHIVSTILGIFIAFMVLKYLDKKPLGMQTIFDEIIKDFIYLNMLDWLTFIVAVAASYFPPLNHYTMNTILICRITMSSAVTYQLSILMLIRYLCVFYPTQMNNAHFAKNLARLFLVYISFTTALLVDKKSMPFYFIASGKIIENGNNAHPLTKPPIVFFITTGVCLMILIFTQYKIEKFNQSVDSQEQHVEEAGGEYQNSSDTYSKNTYRIVLLILCILITLVVLYVLLTPGLHLIDIIFKLLAIKHIILHNVIPIIFIVRNELLFSFMKIQIMKILKCKCRNNQIERIIELNVL